MKKLLVQLLMITLLISCTTAKKEGINISGKIDGISEGNLILEQRGSDGYVLVDTTYLENGEFSFTLKSKLPEVYYLRVDQYDSPVVFFAGDSDVNISANVDSLDKAIITGSIAQDQYESYNKETAKFDLKMSALYEEYKAAKGNDDLVLADSLDMLMDEVYEQKGEYLSTYLLENNKSFAGPYIASRSLYSFELPELSLLRGVLAPSCNVIAGLECLLAFRGSP